MWERGNPFIKRINSRNVAYAQLTFMAINYAIMHTPCGTPPGINTISQVYSILPPNEGIKSEGDKMFTTVFSFFLCPHFRLAIIMGNQTVLFDALTNDLFV